MLDKIAELWFHFGTKKTWFIFRKTTGQNAFGSGNTLYRELRSPPPFWVPLLCKPQPGGSKGSWLATQRKQKKSS